jgi:hypothetical protein
MARLQHRQHMGDEIVQALASTGKPRMKPSAAPSSTSG